MPKLNGGMARHCVLELRHNSVYGIGGHDRVFIGELFRLIG